MKIILSGALAALTLSIAAPALAQPAVDRSSMGDQHNLTPRSDAPGGTTISGQQGVRSTTPGSMPTEMPMRSSGAMMGTPSIDHPMMHHTMMRHHMMHHRHCTWRHHRRICR